MLAQNLTKTSFKYYLVFALISTVQVFAYQTHLAEPLAGIGTPSQQAEDAKLSSKSHLNSNNGITKSINSLKSSSTLSVSSTTTPLSTSTAQNTNDNDNVYDENNSNNSSATQFSNNLSINNHIIHSQSPLQHQTQQQSQPPQQQQLACPEGKILTQTNDNIALTNNHSYQCIPLKQSCTNWGTCSQKCKQLDAFQVACSCKAGFKLAEDNFTCKSLHKATPILMYSIRQEIKSFDLDFGQNGKNKSRTLISGLKNTIALDLFYSDTEGYIFWTDVVDEKIYRGTIINNTVTNVDVVVQTGLATAEGLAVDWIGRNIYWVESNLDQIEVADMQGISRRTLVAGDMDNPRAISVDPRYGYLFWSDWDKHNPRIERITMAGEERTIISSIKDHKGGWPNGLTLDYENTRVYWIDANSDSIHTVDYDGQNHRMLVKDIKLLNHPFAITSFENNLYWTDWKTNSVVVANKFNGSDSRELQHLPTRIFDIKVYHPSRQPRLSDESLNPCHLNKGNCSHLCLLSTKLRRRCDCPHLMRLKDDNMTCESNEEVLLLGKPNEIRGVDIKQPLYHIISPISVPKVFLPKQFEFEAKSRRIFWADTQLNEVRRAQLIGGTIETIIDVVIEAPSGLALDWISGNIYVTSQVGKNPGKIYISNLNGEFISILMDASSKILSPKSLAVHPVRGLLFCVDEENLTGQGVEPVIFMSRMDGSDRKVITSKTMNPNLDSPSSLAMDYELNRLYWVNVDNSSIQYYDIDKDLVVTLWDDDKQTVNNKLSPSVLCLHGQDLIVATKSPYEVLVRMSKHANTTTSKEMMKLTQSSDQLTALKVYNSSAQVGSNACSVNNGGCKQLCVPTDSTHRVCKCTIGYSISSQNETDCLGQDLFMIFSYNWGMKGVSIEPDSSPDDLFLPPIHKAYKASSIDFVHSKNLIYWVDNEDGSITKIRRDTTGHQVIVHGLESEESIGIDWVAENIYWLDPYYDLIEIARLDGSHRYVIISGDMDKANGIAVNPLRGYIVWSDVGSNPKIEMAKLDGSDRRIVVNTSISHINDIAIDYLEDFIYWVDSALSMIERIKIDGSDRQVVLNSSHPYQSTSYSHPISIALYQQYIYVADSVSYSGSIIRYDKNNASNRVTIQHDLGDGIKDVIIFNKQPMPPPETNPCVSNNGNCSDLCLYLGSPGQRRCICSHGRLANDGVSCQPYDVFIMFSKLSQIDSLHVKDDESPINSPFKPIIDDRLTNIIALSVDSKSGRVIYSEITHGQISSVLINGTDTKVLVEKQGLVEGVAYIDKQLFWTSITDYTISRMNITSDGRKTEPCPSSTEPQGKMCISGSNATEMPVIEKIIKLSLDDKPRGIAVDQCYDYIYWTNWNQQQPSIQRASHHNAFKVESIITSDIKMPNGIAIDHQLHKLYWCDARLDKIETCHLDGTQRVILVSAVPQHPFAVAVWDNYVFWTDWLARGVYKANKFTGEQSVQVKKNIQRPMGITVVAPENLECSRSPCLINNGGCHSDSFCKLDLDGKIICECKIKGGCQRDREIHEVIQPPIFKPSNKACSKHPHLCQQWESTMSPDDSIIFNPIKSEHFTSIDTDEETYRITTELPTTEQTTQLATQPTTSAPPCLQTTTVVNSVPIESNKQPIKENSCLSNQFHCYLTTNHTVCINNTSKCDGFVDCPGQEDENDCRSISSQTHSQLSSNSYKNNVNWFSYIAVILIILATAIAALVVVIGSKNRGRRKWLVGGMNGSIGFNHRRMFDDVNGTNIEINNPMFDEDDSASLIHCAFSIDLNERTTNFSNPLYERQVLLVDEKANLLGSPRRDQSTCLNKSNTNNIDVIDSPFGHRADDRPL